MTMFSASHQWRGAGLTIGHRRGNDEGEHGDATSEDTPTLPTSHATTNYRLRSGSLGPGVLRGISMKYV
jgi:hypothetical protein